MKKIIYSLVSIVLVSCSSGTVEAQVINNVSAVEFNKRINSDEGIILDVRTIQEVNEGHIEDATNIDFYASDFTEKLVLIRKDVPIYVYCRSGGRSSKSVAIMQDLGFKKVYNLLGGFGAWKAEDFKVVVTKGHILKKQEAMSIIEFSDVIKSNDIVLVDFSTQWCVPCKKMKPVIEEIEKENRDVKVVYIDADVNKELVEKYKIRGVPVFIVFKDGEEQFRHVGLIDKKELINKIMNIQELINDAATTIVDVRTVGEFSEGNVSGSINIPLHKVVERIEELKEMQPLVLCCLSGGRSGQATAFLQAQGCEDVHNGGGWKMVKAQKA